LQNVGGIGGRNLAIKAKEELEIAREEEANYLNITLALEKRSTTF